ncbi:related to chloroperoxidase [Ramularia collo-cygni]|uniref:Related to chloroperoxidase n=1 Tax=Ramularia collo-cygni TaxID=112498 RepID=A0A2D3VI30_9PEZI|nr:related to chloroperoxidase [Ramularia collo-cygni]CZT23931.1 related to chloroperoxidase [Ramularia collo-cygni]
MKTTLASLAFLATIVNTQALDLVALLAGGAAPDSDPRWLDWKPAGYGDSRSPCPGLNSLANHGFLNHNGKDITIPQLVKGGREGMNMGADFMSIIGAVGLQSSPFPSSGKFDLSDLDQHNFPIEHDGSLSRQDAFFGDNYDFNKTIFNQFLSNFHGAAKTTIPTTSKARYSRIQDSQARNPTFTYGALQFLLSSGETGLYVQTMSSPVENSARLDYIKMMFEKERLPFNIGWRASKTQITLMTLGQYILEMFAANPDNAAEGLTLTAGTLGSTLATLAGGSHVLSNITEGITDALDLPFLQ